MWRTNKEKQTNKQKFGHISQLFGIKEKRDTYVLSCL